MSACGALGRLEFPVTEEHSLPQGPLCGSCIGAGGGRQKIGAGGGVDRAAAVQPLLLGVTEEVEKPGAARLARSCRSRPHIRDTKNA